MEISLKGRCLLVTGAIQGLGETITLASGTEAVTIIGRGAAKGAAVDLAPPDAPADLFGHSLAAMGRVDGLVNAAALTTRALVLDGTVEPWNRLFSVNTRTP